eukprot:Filipodium_phascolosomae@DN1198_c0_g1_i1.p1
MKRVVQMQSNRRSGLVRLLLVQLLSTTLLVPQGAAAVDLRKLFGSIVSKVTSPSMSLDKMLDEKGMAPFLDIMTPDMPASGYLGGPEVSEMLQSVGEKRTALQIQHMMYEARKLLDGQEVAQSQRQKGVLSLDRHDCSRLFMHVGEGHDPGLAYLTSALAFKTLDANNDARLSPSETHLVEKLMRFSSDTAAGKGENVEAIASFDDADTNHDSFLDFREFYSAAKKMGSSPVFQAYRDPKYRQFVQEYSGKIPDMPSSLKEEYARLGISVTDAGIPNLSQVVEKTPSLKEAVERIPGGMAQVQKLTDKLMKNDGDGGLNEILGHFEMPKLPQGLSWDGIRSTIRRQQQQQ